VFTLLSTISPLFALTPFLCGRLCRFNNTSNFRCAEKTTLSEEIYRIDPQEFSKNYFWNYLLCFADPVPTTLWSPLSAQHLKLPPVKQLWQKKYKNFSSNHFWNFLFFAESVSTTIAFFVLTTSQTLRVKATLWQKFHKIVLELFLKSSFLCSDLIPALLQLHFTGIF